jgi:preprotein translocase subunit SecA
MMAPFNNHASAQLLPSPGLAWGHYPQQRSQQSGTMGLARWVRLGNKNLARLPNFRAPYQSKRLRKFAEVCQERISQFASSNPADLDAILNATRAQISLNGLTEPLALELTALVAQYCRRVLGKQAYLVQLMAVRVLLDNSLAQMQTGEGKTLVVGLTSAVAALSGVPVLVITANDYLVARDRELMTPLFDALGLGHAGVLRESTPDDRRAAYGQAICYCTAKEVGFDYLRDQANRSAENIAANLQLSTLLDDRIESNPLPSPMLRGLCMAIIDEADSILLDEAVTPLILSRAVHDEAQIARLKQALTYAKQLWPTTHFTVAGNSRTCQLTAEGQAELARRCELRTSERSIENVWKHQRLREELVVSALNALKVYACDRDYVVREGELKMIDQPTGRVAEGRKWSRGIHQLLEIKEGLEPSAQTETMAQISYQILFPRFLRLCGVSGSLIEARAELKSIYKLDTIAIPLNQASRRQIFKPRLFASRQEKWKEVLKLCKALHSKGRPILLGTDSVAAARTLGKMLSEVKLKHRVLTAAQDADEAQVVSAAGELGAITITTNMAGRGTDIHITPEVEQLGGLAVISCYLNSERRIDRQLIGRGARQGQRGSCHSVISLDDPLFIKTLPTWLDRFLRSRIAPSQAVSWPWIVRIAQGIEESRASRQRLQLLENQLSKDKLLAMAGKGE